MMLQALVFQVNKPAERTHWHHANPPHDPMITSKGAEKPTRFVPTLTEVVPGQPQNSAPDPVRQVPPSVDLDALVADATASVTQGLHEHVHAAVGHAMRTQQAAMTQTLLAQLTPLVAELVRDAVHGQLECIKKTVP
jgi:hypothetical protein